MTATDPTNTSAGTVSTAERIEQIRARAEAATSGPWKADGLAGDLTSGDIVIAEVLSWWQRDAEFIAAAREDVPYLLGLLAERDARHALLVEAGVILGGECERLSAVATQQDATIQRVRDVHQPERRVISVPVFDEFDRPTQVVHGCTCGARSYPCPTLAALDGQEGR